MAKHFVRVSSFLLGSLDLISSRCNKFPHTSVSVQWMMLLVEEHPTFQDSVGADDIGDLYRRHAPKALRMAYLITGDASLAQDLVHDAFVKMASRVLPLRHPEAFPAYMQRTIRNLAHSYFRHKRIEREHQRTNPGPRESHDPSLEVDARGALWAALLNLSQRQRTAIVLRFYMDMSDEDAAGVLGCRPATVRSLVSRGLQALRPEVTDG